MSKATVKLAKWRALEPWERGFLLRMPLPLWGFWLGLRLIGLKSMLRLAQPAIGNRPEIKPVTDAANPQRCAELTAMAANLCLPAGSCLPRSLALCRKLRKMGFAAQPVIGVRRGGSLPTAHAWVEVDSVPLDGQEQDYTAFPRLP